MQNPESTAAKGTSDSVLRSRRLFSRDLNYLRDVALVWPFVICSVAAVATAFSPPDRQFGLRCAALAIVALLLGKEKLLMFFGALGLVAIRGAVSLVIHPWSWLTFAATALTGIPFLLANRYWRKSKLAYQLPEEYGAVDMLLSFSSICGTIYLIYLVSPHKWGIQ